MPRNLWLIGLGLLLLTPGALAQDTPEETGQTEYYYERNRVVQNEVRELLQNRSYRFCQDPEYRLFQSEKDALCNQLDAFEDTCPQLPQACQRPPWEAEMEVQDEGDWSFWDKLHLDSALLAGFFKVFFWGSLTLGVLVLLRALIRQARHWREERQLEMAAAPTISAEPNPEVAEELRAQVLFEMARSELENNNVTESLHLTYRATVRTLSDAEWVKPHKSKTSGDYQRSLRRLEAARETLEVGEVRGHLRELDRERFRNTPRSDQANQLLKRALAISSRLVQAGALVLLWFTVGCSDVQSKVPELPLLPYAPRGQQLFEDLLNQHAESVHRRQHRMTEVPQETSSVISVGARLKELEWQTLKSWVNSGGHLMVAEPTKDFFDVFEIEASTKECAAPLLAPDLSLSKFYSSRSFTDLSGDYPIANCGNELYAASLDYGEGYLTLIADDQLFENASLAASDNATLALILTGQLYGHIEYLGPWTGLGANHPLQSITRSGFGWWVLHVLLVAIIYAWSRGKRFGTPKDPPEKKRRAFSEHARALSLKYEKAGASGWALRNYAEWVYDHLRRRAPSTKGDMKSLTSAVSSSDREANKLRTALVTARRADELGESKSEHTTTFRRLKSAILGIAEVSRRQPQSKD